MITINKNVLLLSVGRACQVIFAILTVRLLTELLPQDQIGQQYLINSIILWFSMVLINPVGMFVNRHLHEWKSSGVLVFYMKQMNKYFLFVSVISLPIIFCLNYFDIVKNLSDNRSIYVYFILYIFLSTWFQTLVSLFNLFERQKIFIFLNILSQFFGLVFALSLTHFFDSIALTWLFGLLLGQIITLIFAAYFFKKYFYDQQKNIVDMSGAFFNKQTLIFCYPVAVTTLFMWFNTQGYRLLVEHDIGLNSLAALGVGFGLAASVSSVVESVTTQFYYPQYYKSLIGSNAADRAANWNRLWKSTASIYIPFCFLTIAASNFLAQVLTAKQFHYVGPLICLGAIAELFRQFSNIAYLVAHGEKKTKQTILPYASGTILCLILLFVCKTFFLLNEYSVGVILIASGCTICSINLLLVNKMIQIQLDFFYIFKIILMCIPILVTSFFSNSETSVIKLFVLSCLSGFMCISVLIYIKKSIV